MIVEMDTMTAWNVKQIVGERVNELTRKIDELELVTPVDDHDADLLQRSIDRRKRERERLVILLESMTHEPNPYDQ